MKWQANGCKSGVITAENQQKDGLMEEKSEICELAIVKGLTNDRTFGVMTADNQLKDSLMEENSKNCNCEITDKYACKSGVM